MTPNEILDIVQELHSRSEDFDEGDIIERIFLCSKYELTLVSIDSLSDEFATSESLIEVYSQMDPKTVPPVVLIKYAEDDYSIIDGAHRIEAFKKNNIKLIPAYVGVLRK